jgi:hypothetical protein
MGFYPVVDEIRYLRSKPLSERYGDISPVELVESPDPMKGIYFVGVLLNRKP